MKIGIIGGSGLENPSLLEDYNQKDLGTRFGSPSSNLTTGKIAGIEVAILSRHGKKHEIPPTYVNNRANIELFRLHGYNNILATTAVGSLREEIQRGDFVIPDQYIDFTKRRISSFHEDFNSGPVHVSMADPFSGKLRKKMMLACKELGYRGHESGTVITIEGPQFSTQAESEMFRTWRADIINMSTAPEAKLAREAGIEYGVIAMSTDYDCWKKDEEPVTWDQIKSIMSDNSERVQKVLVKTIELLALENN